MKTKKKTQKPPQAVLIKAFDEYMACESDPLLEVRLVEAVVFVTHQSAWRGADMPTVLRFCRWFLRRAAA